MSENSIPSGRFDAMLEKEINERIAAALHRYKNILDVYGKEEAEQFRLDPTRYREKVVKWCK